MTPQSVIRVEYTDGKPDTYQSVIVLAGITEIRYAKSDFKVDIDLGLKIANRLTPKIIPARDPSLDHYIIDADLELDYAWLLNATVYDKGGPTLHFIDTRNEPNE